MNEQQTDTQCQQGLPTGCQLIILSLVHRLAYLGRLLNSQYLIFNTALIKFLSSLTFSIYKYRFIR